MLKKHALDALIGLLLSAVLLILLEGLLQPAGMPRFDDFLSEAEVRSIQAFILEQARRASQETAR